MTTDLHNLTDRLGRLTSELRTLVSQRHTLAIQQKRLVEHSVSLQREYAEQVDRTFSPMLAKPSAPAKSQLQG
jgi:C4-dicarboxylate-specific signal transduction histidine kinase